MRAGYLKGIRRIIVKIGTSTLTDDLGDVDNRVIGSFAEQISRLVDDGLEVLIVTSGAIGCGKKELGIGGRVREVCLRQATAAVGQGILINSYYNEFARRNKKIAQILLTYKSFFDRKSYINLGNSISSLLGLKVIPIINENDPLSTDEIGETFGDNDRLSALVASKINSDLLIICTDTDGLYNKNPHNFRDAKLVREVHDINWEVENYADSSTSILSKGGMKSKIEAAKICLDSGCYVIIANGREKNLLTRIVAGEEIGTIFVPKNRVNSKRRWIKQTPANGYVEIDEGAKKAIASGKNLLPAGVTSVNGNFLKGDVIELIFNKNKFAKVIIDYSSEDLKTVRGKSSKDINKKCSSCLANVFKRENLAML